MTIRQVIKLAQTGELNNIAVKKDIEAIVGYINLGLIELYKRFPLKVEETIVTLEDGKDIYDLPANYMWVVAAYGEVPADSNMAVYLLPINEEDNPLSINTVGYNQLQIPLAIDGAYVSIIYVASPNLINYDTVLDKFTDDNGDEITELELPVQMVESLLHYIGYRAHAAMDGNIQAENSTHYTRFEASCNKIEQRGMYNNDDLSMKDRVQDKGFV